MKTVAIVFGACESPIQSRAVEQLTEMLLDYTTEYPIAVNCRDNAELSDKRCIYIGTAENNPYVKMRSSGALDAPESYAISVKDDTAVIEGYDDAGVLYGVLDFYNKYIVKLEHPHTDELWTNPFALERLPDFEYSSAPSVSERGLWTWGHVIYDYRGYLRNMMKLKMNSVIIWNDFAPINAEQIVEYAHSCNIKVYWGFSWLWDTKCSSVDIRNLDGESERILKKYEDEYASIGGDGIYFQTFTERDEDSINGVIIAEAAARFVNRTAAMIYEKYPSLEIQFGLHATSVKDRLSFIKEVDPGVRIVWEDVGAFPFSYVPTDIGGFDETVELVREIATLRGSNDLFGVVTKGLVKLDWSQFKHLEGPQYIGISSSGMKKNRIERKARIWRAVQAGWIRNADKALEMVSEMCRIKGKDISVFALVEDGMFEENIMYPVSLYSEMLWDCNGDIKELLHDVALRSYVSFA